MKFYLCLTLLFVGFTKASEVPYGVSPGWAGPVSNAQGWSPGGGHAAGSYYHYHVPVVGQQPHYQPQAQQTDHHQILLWLIPLALLALGPLLFLPFLLKLLLVPAGLALLALLMPMMMMMMMMMMPGGMMMMMRNPQQVTSARALGQLLVNDWTEFSGLTSRALFLDKCPERVICTLGSKFGSKTSESTRNQGDVLLQYVLDQAPRGKVKKNLRKYKEAFLKGSQLRDCSQFTCEPKLNFDYEKTFSYIVGGAGTGMNLTHSVPANGKFDTGNPKPVEETVVSL